VTFLASTLYKSLTAEPDGGTNPISSSEVYGSRPRNFSVKIPFLGSRIFFNPNLRRAVTPIISSSRISFNFSGVE
jgi:hypothetical protein